MARLSLTKPGPVKAPPSPTLGERIPSAQVRVIAVEREDFVEPEMATGLRELQVPLRLVAHRPGLRRTGRGTYLIVALPQGRRASEWLDPEEAAVLPPDVFRNEDVVDLERRTIDRENQSAGFISGEVDKPAQPTHSIWIELTPALLGVGLAFGGFMFANSALSG